MLITIATIIGSILLFILLLTVAGSLLSLVFYLASERVTEAQERLKKVQDYEASLKSEVELQKSSGGNVDRASPGAVNIS